MVEGWCDWVEICCEWFGEIGSDGLIVFFGVYFGDVGEVLINGNFELVGECVKVWEVIFFGVFYFEV